MSSVDQFKALSRYSSEPLYSGEQEFIAEIMHAFDRLSLSQIVRMVDSSGAKMSFPWEVRRNWRLRNLSTQMKDRHYDQYAAWLMEFGRSHVGLFSSVLDRFGHSHCSKSTRILDLGTGRGGFIAMAQKDTRFSASHFEGADMDMASLLVNLKLNEEIGNVNYRLICCHGEKLPFEDNRFDIIASFSTLEHVGGLNQQVAFIAESCRCLLPGGVGLFLFPNRFDVFRPEVHVNIRFLGFIPEKWKDRVSHFLRGVPSGDIHPPEPVALMHALRKLHGVSFELHSRTEFSGNGLKRLISSSFLFRLLGPENVLIARK